MSYRSPKSTASPPKTKPQPRSSQEIKPPKLVLGDDLEYRIARLHIYMGYFVRRSCPIYTVGNLSQATDLDVLSLRYNQPLAREALISECKSGDEGPLDRIFWLAGVKYYVGAKEAFLVRKSTKWNIKDFAKYTGVQVLDLHKIEELEKNYKINLDDWPGVSDRAFFAANIHDWNDALMSSTGFWELYQNLISEVRYDEPFANINFLLFQLRRLTKQFPVPPKRTFHRFLIAESINQLSVFLMRVAEKAFDLSGVDRDGFVKKGLTYGNLDPKFADRILNNAYTITKQAILHMTDRPPEIDPTFFQMPVPPGAEQVAILVNEILRVYPLSLTFPQITDLSVTETFVKQNRSGGWLKKIFSMGDLPSRLELTTFYLKQLVEAEACPSFVLDYLHLPIGEGRSKAERPMSVLASAATGVNSVGYTLKALEREPDYIVIAEGAILRSPKKSAKRSDSDKGESANEKENKSSADQSELELKPPSGG